MKFIPNIITCLRILASLLILFVPNKWFFPLYFFAGLTDMLDGWLARKMNWTSPFGTFLDSLADLLFFLVVIAKVVLTITTLFPIPNALIQLFTHSWYRRMYSLSKIFC